MNEALIITGIILTILGLFKSITEIIEGILNRRNTGLLFPLLILTLGIELIYIGNAFTF